MTVIVVRLRRNADKTLTVRVGRALEHIGLDGKTHGQVFDAVRYAIVSKGASLPEIEIAELLYQATGEYYKMIGGRK